MLHNKGLELYRSYLVIGGMPEAVAEFVKTKSYIASTLVVKEIYSNYLNDLPKYATNSETFKNKECFESITRQLFKENKNFKYSEVEKGKDSKYFGSSINWLTYAGISLKSRLVEIPRKPLNYHLSENLFRLYLSDVGLFRYCAKSDISSMLDINYRDNTTGILAGNYVACELTANQIDLYYWQGKRMAEIEFLIEDKDGIIPIEVKAGTRVTSKSLEVYKQTYSVHKSYRISGKNFGLENNVKSVPLYAVFCLAEEIISSENKDIK